MALSAASLGAMPHIVFSLQIGAIRAFKAAFDEDVYVDLALHGPVFPHRLLSVLCVRVFRSLLGGNAELAWMAMDIVFPAACAALAAHVACRFSRRLSGRTLITGCFLFGQELFSFGCAAVWPLTVANVRPLLPSWASSLLPYSFTSYLGLYRTPEPQVSWLVMWICIASAVSLILTDAPRFPRGAIAGLAGAALLLPFSYMFISVPLVMLGALLGIASCMLGKRNTGLGLMGSALAAALAIAAAAAMSPGTLWRVSYLFPSRLPVLAPSVLIAALALTWTVWTGLRQGVDRQLALPAAAFLIIPILLMNQQLVTGWMIMAKNWECHANYPLVMAGLTLLVSSVRRHRVLTRTSLLPRLSQACTVLLLLALVWAGVRTYSMWFPINEAVVAMERAATAALSAVPDEAMVVVVHPTQASFVSLRLPQRLHPLLSYADLVLRPIAPLPPAPQTSAGAGAHQERLFEYFARTGLGPRMFAAEVKREVAQSSGDYLGFLFNFRDAWFPASDSRALRPLEIARQIPGIVDEYARRSASPPSHWHTSALLLTDASPEELGSGGWWRNILIARGRVGRHQVFAYEQVPLVKRGLRHAPATYSSDAVRGPG